MAYEAYHPLYLRGVAHFNRGDFFASHEVWEDLWRKESGRSRQFYKGLIQAAVALYHLTHGNQHGAAKLLAGSQSYLEPYRSRYMGLDVDGFLAALGRCVTTALSRAAAGGGLPALVDLASIPRICLQPPPSRLAQ
jgi:predicted metal-dependent hydrolase